MKIKTIILVVALLSLMFTGFSCSKVPAGYSGVKVYLLGSAKGVDTEELGPGRYWIGWNQDLYLFPMFTQNYVWTKDAIEGSPNDESITFQTKEGLSVNADIGISYYIIPGHASKVFQKYRKGIDEITDIFLRNVVRDALITEASKRSVESVYGSGKADMMDEVASTVKENVKEIGIFVENIYLVGSLRLPTEVIRALNSKIEATQRAEQRENELRESEAEAKKIVAKAKGDAEAVLTAARSQAEANIILAKSITPQLVQYEMVKNWNGVLPQVTAGGSGVDILLAMPQNKKE